VAEKERNMAGVAGAACSSNVLFRSREVRNHGASMAQYNGLRPVENMQMAPTGSKPSGSVSTSGMSLLNCASFFIYLAMHLKMLLRNLLVVYKMQLATYIGAKTKCLNSCSTCFCQGLEKRTPIITMF